MHGVYDNILHGNGIMFACIATRRDAEKPLVIKGHYCSSTMFLRHMKNREYIEGNFRLIVLLLSERFFEEFSLFPVQK